MSECNPLTYHNVTPDIFECMKKKLKDAGIQVSPGNGGDIEGSGVKAHFEWDGISNLKIIIQSKSFISSCGYVIGKIADFVHECQGS